MALTTDAASETISALVIEREFDAPRELVFKLWSEPQHRAMWWGPEGHGLDDFSMDFRVGGAWSVTIQNPDGSTAQMYGVFNEIIAPSRLCFTYHFDEVGIHSTVEIDFVVRDAHTVMHFRQSPFPSEAEKASHNWGWSSSFIQFTAYLQHMLLSPPGTKWTRELTGVAADVEAARERARQETRKSGPAGKELRIERIFAAPRELVFRMWSDPTHALRWMGPRHAPAVSFKQDFRVGGKWRGCLRGIPESNGGDAELWQGGVYREIQVPERIVFTFQWDGGAETLCTVELFEHGTGTRMVFTQGPFDIDSNRDGHTEGWNSAFDRLVDLIVEPIIQAQFGSSAGGRISGLEADIRAAKHRQDESQSAENGRTAGKER